MAQQHDGPAYKKRKLDNDEMKHVCNLLGICSGTLDFSENKKITLKVDKMSMNAMKITQDDYAYLDDNLDVCHDRLYKENIIDQDLYHYKEKKYFNFDLDIKTILKRINVEGYVDQYALHYYKTGDFCHPPCSSYPGLIGTLILLLPSEHEGGEFNFGGYKVEENMDKSTLRFIYFRSDSEHSIDQVISGQRLFLVYHIYDPNYQREDVVVSDKINIFFHDQHYKELLDYTIKYCEGKQNILLGYYKHCGDAINNRLLRDIKAKYDVITVAVEKKTSMSKISTVHQLKDDFYEDVVPFENEPDGVEQQFDDLVDKEYKVQHKLFTEHFDLKYNKIMLVTETGYRGYSEDEREYPVEFYTAYLINPKIFKPFSTMARRRGYISEEETDSDDNETDGEQSSVDDNDDDVDGHEKDDDDDDDTD